MKNRTHIFSEILVKKKVLKNVLFAFLLHNHLLQRDKLFIWDIILYLVYKQNPSSHVVISPHIIPLIEKQLT